jgi:hypothetical protein
MKTTHTPGPWRTCLLSYQQGGRGQVVAEVPTCFGTIAVRADPVYPCPSKDKLDAEGQANARLIAAAPDMLAACESALERIDGMNEAMHIVDELRSAIAKAKGVRP